MTRLELIKEVYKQADNGVKDFHKKSGNFEGLILENGFIIFFHFGTKIAILKRRLDLGFNFGNGYGYSKTDQNFLNLVFRVFGIRKYASRKGGNLNIIDVE